MRTLTVSEITGMQGVKRWHTAHAFREQTVADHSATVAQLALRIGGDDLSLESRFHTLLLGLQHDAHEAAFGDTPSPVRRAYLALGIDLDAIGQRHFWGEENPLSCFSPLIHDLVAVADKLEAALFARRFVPDLAHQTAEEAQAAAMTVLADEHRWGMRGRALEIIKEIL